MSSVNFLLTDCRYGISVDSMNELRYCRAAFEAIRPWLFLLPADVQRKIKLALSVIDSHGMATAEELNTQLGKNWVIARRSQRIIDKYGKDVVCVSNKQFEDAVEQAIESRF